MKAKLLFTVMFVAYGVWVTAMVLVGNPAAAIIGIAFLTLGGILGIWLWLDK